ncbi:Hypothetical predicted protein, partial [Pelobates cultripes]
DRGESATWERRSGPRVLVSSSPATGKNTHTGPPKMNSAAPELGIEGGRCSQPPEAP